MTKMSGRDGSGAMSWERRLTSCIKNVIFVKCSHAVRLNKSTKNFRGRRAKEEKEDNETRKWERMRWVICGAVPDLDILYDFSSTAIKSTQYM